MKHTKSILSKVSTVRKYRFNTIISIAFLWTLVDIIVVLVFNSLPSTNKLGALLLRETIVFISSIGVGFLLVSELKRLFRDFNLLTALIIKSIILIVAAFLINLLLFALNSVSILGLPFSQSFHHFYVEFSDIRKLLQKILYWLILFVVTQLLIELNEKYSPGVFMDILLGKYVHPKIETRIVMFMDLKDSTPIAEKLGSQKYFRFIREFIYQVSNALIEYGGRIYQYVGDEIVVSWLYNKENARKSVHALVQARRNLNKRQRDFKKKYGILPEFRVGIHIGVVTVGEIGVIKKDLAMSGDTMNTAARIRTCCSELDQRYLASKEFVVKARLDESQVENLGMVELKGKTKDIELYALKI
jgi:adenylate cyclase